MTHKLTLLVYLQLKGFDGNKFPKIITKLR